MNYIRVLQNIMSGFIFPYILATDHTSDWHNCCILKWWGTNIIHKHCCKLFCEVIRIVICIFFEWFQFNNVYMMFNTQLLLLFKQIKYHLRRLVDCICGFSIFFTIALDFKKQIHDLLFLWIRKRRQAFDQQSVNEICILYFNDL